MDARGLIRGVFRRDRLTGQLAVAGVAVLGVAAVVYGVGRASDTYELSDVGAWLVSSNGPAVHVNGLSGKVDGKTGLPGSNGHKLRVVQDHGTVLIIDETTGVVSRIDPSQLEVAQTRKLGAAGTQVVIGKKTAYTIDPRAGSVQRIDPVSLASLGKPIALAPPLGQSAVDARGALWVPVPAAGQSTPVSAGVAGRPVSVGRAGDRLALTVAAGVPVVVNSTSAAAMVVSSGGERLRVSLPSSVRRAGLGGVLAPATTEGQTVPLLAEKAGALVLVDTGNGGLSATSVRLPRHRYSAPQILGTRVYIPDQTTGRVYVYDTAANHFQRSITVSGRSGALDAFVKDGLLWINDPNGSTALVINDHGGVHRISKYAAKVPGGPQKTAPGKPHVGRTGDNGNGGRPDGNGDHRPKKHKRPTPRPTTPKPTTPPVPGSPGNVTVEPQSGGVRVSFDPPSTGKPKGYSLIAPSGYTVKPKQVGAGGPYTFQATGGDCAAEVTFRVAALYDGTRKLSPPSEPVRPCITPGSPQRFAAKAVNHGAHLTWQTPANAAGTMLYKLTANGTTRTVSGTSYDVSGLTNGQAYDFKLRAVNPAGESTAAVASANLEPVPHMFENAYNDDTNTIVRAGPSTSSRELGRIPKGHYQQYKVICQVQGERYTDDYQNRTSTVWDRFEWNGQIAYMSDLFFKTPRSGTNEFSDPPLWECPK